jgi:hypothetical protein
MNIPDRLTLTIIGVISLSVAVGTAASIGRLGPLTHGEHDVAALGGAGPVLPEEANARRVLGTTPRHIEWVAVPFGARRILAFVVSPERSDRAPVVIVTEHNQGASDRVRAVADQVAAAGFIAVVPDVLTGEGPAGGDTDSFRGADLYRGALARLGSHEIAQRTEAVRRFALTLPAGNGVSARLDLHEHEFLLYASAEPPAERSAKFELSEQGFSDSLSFLGKQTNDHPVFMANTVENEHAMHFAMLASAAGKPGEIGQPRPARGRHQLSPQAPRSADGLLHGKINSGRFEIAQRIRRHSGG